jgi:hypothetical protein
MDSLKKEAVDIFGTKIKPGTVILFGSAGAQLDVAVVTKVRWQGKNKARLIGFAVEYPYQPSGATGKKVITKKKTIRAGRELVCVPAGKLGSLASGQARYTHAFVERLQYISAREKEQNEQ